MWDSEEIIFFLLFMEFLFIKVIEVKGLVNYVVVGSVFCEIKDLFVVLF